MVFKLFNFAPKFPSNGRLTTSISCIFSRKFSVKRIIHTSRLECRIVDGAIGPLFYSVPCHNATDTFDTAVGLIV